MTPENTLQHIQRYIARQHVFPCLPPYQDDIWAASCYYAFDRQNMRLIFMTSPDSQHGQLMQANPRVAGTISAQTKQVGKIQGVQFVGKFANLLVKRWMCRKHFIASDSLSP